MENIDWDEDYDPGEDYVGGADGGIDADDLMSPWTAGSIARYYGVHPLAVIEYLGIYGDGDTTLTVAEADLIEATWERDWR